MRGILYPERVGRRLGDAVRTALERADLAALNPWPRGQRPTAFRSASFIRPCQPGPPPKIVDTKKQPTSQEDAMRETTNFGPNAIATYAGIPALSVPCGFTSAGMPIGILVQKLSPTGCKPQSQRNQPAPATRHSLAPGVDR